MENMILPEGFEWCRKAKYDVQVELGCYVITDSTPLKEGFEEQIVEENGAIVKYAVKSGFNILEQNNWTTSSNKPFILTGTVGERWPVKLSDMAAYDVDVATIGLDPMTISTKDPDDQEFMVAFNIPEEVSAKVIPSWAFADDGSIDESQIMIANSPSSMVDHNGGDYIVAKHIPDMPEYMELSEEERNTKETAQLYDPRIVNGSIMQTTYDHALTQDEIIAKYQESIHR
ncbi:MAG: hypothetical protein IJL74_02715 [Bacilli bacterium]|nr:hypothetical protein [Bacilli bacterium]